MLACLVLQMPGEGVMAQQPSVSAVKGMTSTPRWLLKWPAQLLISFVSALASPSRQLDKEIWAGPMIQEIGPVEESHVALDWVSFWVLLEKTWVITN